MTPSRKDSMPRTRGVDFGKASSERELPESIKEYTDNVTDTEIKDTKRSGVNDTSSTHQNSPTVIHNVHRIPYPGVRLIPDKQESTKVISKLLNMPKI